MSVEIKMNRASIYNEFSQIDLQLICSNPGLKYLQTRDVLAKDSYCNINECLKRQDNLQFRVYGFGNSSYNMQFLEHIPDVKELAIQGFDSIDGISSLYNLSKLEKLVVSVNKFPQIDFLSHVNINLKELSIGSPMKSKRDLNIIKQFAKLKCLFIYGIESDYEFVAKLQKLKKLTINAVALPNISYINETNIEDLSLGFTSKYDLSQLADNTVISRLSLWKNIKISNLEVLQGFVGLQHCELKELSQVEKFPNLRALRELTSVVLDTMSKMNNISEIANLSNVNSLKMYQMKQLSPNDIRELLKRKRFDDFFCTTGNVKNDKEIRTIVENIQQET